jgi:hypothetical protein
MSDAPTDVLVAGYQDIDTANTDFESLVATVHDDEHALNQHTALNAVAQGVGA